MTLAEILAKKKGGGSAAPGSGLTITPETEKAALAAQIKGVLDAGAPKAQPPAPRELGAAERGERIPMDHPGPDATEEDRAWFSACHALDTRLGVVIEPGETGEHAWIACSTGAGRAPILLHRLPLLHRPSGGNPF